MMGDADLLAVENLTMRFGGLMAVDDLDLVVREGEIRGLIGPNGAGKTTLFNAVSGRYPATGGTIRLRDRDITNLKPHDIVQHGLARTFQHVTLFKGFSVLKSVMAGCQINSGYDYWGALFNTRATRQRERETEAKARNLLRFIGLGDAAEENAASLPHGHQRSLGIAIAMATEPSMLLLDEPCAGMNIEESREMIALIQRIRDAGITIMLIEHDMKVVMGVCEKITVLNFGTKIAEGTPEEVRENAQVREAYLGSQANVP